VLTSDLTAEFAKYRSLGEKAMVQVSEEALNRVLAPEGNSIAMLVRHIGGNLTSRFTDFLTTDGEKPSRDRDGEFGDGTFSREHVNEAWTNGWSVVENTLNGLSDADLEKGVSIRGEAITVHQALVRSLAHISMHVGQIILLARILASDDWQTLSIPKGQSKQFNQSLAQEKASTR